MIRRKVLLLPAVAALLSTVVYASQIRRLELVQLPERAEVTVLAQVLKVEEKAEADEVTIKIASVLKGEIQQNELKILLKVRGVRDFDPRLKVGETGVFFLRDVVGTDAKLAYWGSVAVFQKSHFEVTKK